MRALQIPSYDYQVDICVIGSGGSGLSAAMRAFESGAKKVLVIEKGKVFGGGSRLPSGIMSVDSPVQKRMGIRENADELYREHMNLTNWSCDAMLVRKWFTATGDNIRWLEDLGVHFENVVPFLGQANKTKRLFHMANFQKTGNEIVKALINGLTKAGVEMLLKTRAKRLIVDDEGHIAGVIAQQENREVSISAKSVILATGSISANKELVARFYPGKDFSETKIMSAIPHNTGDGFLMAQEIGAGVGSISTSMIGPHNHPNNMKVGLIMKRPHLVYLNKYGERFVDESLTAWHDWGWMVAIALDRQPGRKCYPIMDSALLEDMVTHKKILNNVENIESRTKSQDILATVGTEKPVETNDDVDATAWLDTIMDDINSEAEKGRVLIADTLDEVADWMGASRETVHSTIKEYNEYCRCGYDNDFLKDPEYLCPIVKPPFYVFTGYQGVDTCIGGIPVNHRQEVLREDRTPIPGLYAAGVCTSGWMGFTYGYFGSCMSYVIYSGYAAGENASKHIKE